MFYSTYDATKSWYGYEYQGKLAIKKTLEYILDEIIKKKIHNFDELENYMNKLNLEIENNEDFALLKNQTYKSIHQVKTGKVDSEAINNMFFCYCEKYNNINLYLHYTEGDYNYAHGLKNFKTQLNTTIETIDKYLSKQLDINEIKLDKRKKKKHSLEQALLYLQSSKENLENNLNEIKKILLSFNSKKIDESKFIFKKEKYAEINLEIKNIIKSILSKINPKFSDIEKIIEYKLLNMCQILDNHLEKIVTEENNQPISFLKIIEVLKKDDLKLPENYIAYLKLERIIKYLQEACENKEICENKNCETECDVKKVLKKLRKIRGQELTDFIKRINFPYGVCEDIGSSNLDKLLEKLVNQLLKLEKNNFYIKEKTECGTLDIREEKFKRKYIREFNKNRKNYNELLREKKIFLTENLKIENIINKTNDYSETGYKKNPKDILEENDILITTYKERGK